MVSLNTFLVAQGKKALVVVVVILLLSLDDDDDSMQRMSYQLLLEQPAPSPTPNGYGTVMLPHLRGQPGLVVFGVVIMVSGGTVESVGPAAIVMARSSPSHATMTLNKKMRTDILFELILVMGARAKLAKQDRGSLYMYYGIIIRAILNLHVRVLPIPLNLEQATC